MAWSSEDPIPDLDLVGEVATAAFDDQAPAWEDIPPEFKDRQSPWYAIGWSLVTDTFNATRGGLETKAGYEIARVEQHVRLLSGFKKQNIRHRAAAIAYILSLTCRLISAEE